MVAPKPLQGTELVDCAAVSKDESVETVAQQCGYGDDVSAFEQQLRQACQKMGIEIHNFSDFVKANQRHDKDSGMVIAPDTPTQL